MEQKMLVVSNFPKNAVKFAFYLAFIGTKWLVMGFAWFYKCLSENFDFKQPIKI